MERINVENAYDWQTENYSWRCANFQRFISVTVYHTVEFELFNRCTLLLRCYSATVFLTGSSIPFNFWSWTWSYKCNTSDGFLTVSSFTYTVYAPIVENCTFFLIDILKKYSKLMFITSFTWICSATKIMHNLWSIFQR